MKGSLGVLGMTEKLCCGCHLLIISQPMCEGNTLSGCHEWVKFYLANPCHLLNTEFCMRLDSDNSVMHKEPHKTFLNCSMVPSVDC